MSLFGVQITVQLSRIMMQLRIQLGKSKYRPNFRTIYASLVAYDRQVSGLIRPSDFEKCLNNNGIFFTKYDIQVLEKAYKNQDGLISWFTLMSHLREPMGPSRRQFVEQIFDFMDTDKKGALSPENLRINHIMLVQYLNPKSIQSYKMGLKSRETIQQEFVQMLSIPQGVITKPQFVAFYDDLSINFPNNDIFFRYVGSQWDYSPSKQAQAKEEDIKAVIKSLRTKLIQSSQGAKDQFILKKLYDYFDVNHNGCVGSYELDLIFKNMGIHAEPRIVEPVLQRIDYNKTGYIQFADFKQLLFKDPYPVDQ